jgi:hypothetical protein
MHPSPKNWPGSRIATTASLAQIGHDRKLDLAFLNIKHRVRNIALLENVLIFVKFQYRFPRAYIGEKVFGVKHCFGWLLHWSLLHRLLLQFAAHASRSRVKDDAGSG